MSLKKVRFFFQMLFWYALLTGFVLAGTMELWISCLAKTHGEYGQGVTYEGEHRFYCGERIRRAKDSRFYWNVWNKEVNTSRHPHDRTPVKGYFLLYPAPFWGFNGWFVYEDAPYVSEWFVKFEKPVITGFFALLMVVTVCRRKRIARDSDLEPDSEVQQKGET